jgi:excisionase family DNA binding protein
MEEKLSAFDKIAVPSPQDVELAARSSRILSKLQPEKALTVQIDGERLVLPKAVFSLLSKILTEMSAGNAVKIFPIHAQLTTQEAAEFLNVSRPYLIKLIEANELACTMVGTHRRVSFQELQAYKAKRDSAAQAAMADLVTEAQEENMGY